MPSPSESPIDTSLLAGFVYACRPECGLCCYAEPLVSADDRPKLLSIAAEPPLVTRGRFEFVRSRPDGGACSLLEGNRCRAHAGRPSPCREFPVTVHVGARLQATAVLTCPGVRLDRLDGYDPEAPAGAPLGFEDELRSVRARAGRSAARRVDESVRRRRRIQRALADQDRWEEEDDVRRDLTPRLPELLGALDASEMADPPPRSEDGLERLPLIGPGARGPLALASGLGGWELLELAPEGGIAAERGVAMPAARPPALAPEARRRVEGYLRYWLSRDALFGTVHLAMLDHDAGTVAEWTAAELQRVAATTLARSHVLAAIARGPVDLLRAADLEAGIRATDQDLLDRPTWGARL